MTGARTRIPGLALAGALLLGCADRPGLVLITVDTLRVDHVGAHGGPLGLTPRLDGLAAESIVFERAYAPSSYTLPSVVGLLTGRHPEEAGVDYNTHRLRGDVPTLAGLLAERGWSTGAVVSNYVLRPASGVDRGFRHFDADFEERERLRGQVERTAGPTTDAALAMLDRLRDEGGDAFFLWVHYQDPHGPYTPPAGGRARYLETERQKPGGGRRLPISRDGSGVGGVPAYQLGPLGEHTVAYYRAGYDAEIAYTDAEIGRFLDAARERHALDAAIVVFAADHGEALGEADLWFAHGERLIEPLVRVPLWLRVPGRTPERRSDVASLVDVLPTLAALLGFELPPDQRGRDLLEPASRAHGSVVYFALPGRGHTKLPRYGLIRGDYKYVVERGSDGPLERLTRVGSDAPDLAAEDPARVTDMRVRLREIRERLPTSAHAETLTPEERRRLEALGYGTL